MKPTPRITIVTPTYVHIAVGDAVATIDHADSTRAAAAVADGFVHAGLTPVITDTSRPLPAQPSTLSHTGSRSGEGAVSSSADPEAVE